MMQNEEEASTSRYYALLSLKAFKEKPDEKIIRQFLYQRDPLLKQGAIDLISWFGLKNFRDRLEVEIMNRNASVALDAIYALMELGCHESTTKLSILENSSNTLIRDAASYAIRRLLGIKRQGVPNA
jgi:hypothetical protein